MGNNKPIEADELPEINFSDMEIFKEGRKVVEKFVNEHKRVTIGALSRELPYYRTILMSILIDLRTDQKLDFDDLGPPPTVVKAMSVVEKDRKDQMERNRQRYLKPKKQGKNGWTSRPIPQAQPHRNIDRFKGKGGSKV